MTNPRSTALSQSDHIHLEPVNTQQSHIGYWNEFQNISMQNQGPIRDSIQFDFHKHDTHVVILGLVHGNETGSLPAIVECIKNVRDGELIFGGKITFILGNREAYFANTRFIGEDLNRMFFDFDNVTSPEKRRAAEIASVIDDADFVLDLHQTIGPTSCPFYVFKDKPMNHLWARALGAADHLISADSGKYICEGLVSAMEYADARDIPALVIELSEMGIRKSAHLIAHRCISNLLTLMDLIESRQISIMEAAEDKPKIKHLQLSDHIRFDTRRKRLLPHWKNLQFVTKGTTLGYNENDSQFVMPRDGYVLFPKYPPRNAMNEAIGTIPSSIVEIAVPTSE